MVTNIVKIIRRVIWPLDKVIRKDTLKELTLVNWLLVEELTRYHLSSFLTFPGYIRDPSSFGREKVV